MAKDNWGALDDYIRQYTDKNRITINGMKLDTAIMNRYKYAPVNGEPIPGGSFSDGCDYGDLKHRSYVITPALLAMVIFLTTANLVCKVISGPLPKQLAIA